MMDLKERLDRLTNVSQSREQDRSERDRSRVIDDLKQRLNRVFEPRKAYRRQESVPIDSLVKGEIVSTPYGEAFLAKKAYPPEFRFGEISLQEVLNISTQPAHLLSKDERLKEMDLRSTLFLDTETTGLSGGTGTFAFLIGLGFFEGDGFSIRQLFMRDYVEEKASLSILNQFLESFQYLVTFNGRHFDIPLLETRFILSRMASRIREMPNFDLLFPSRKIWKGTYENCRLVTLESRLLGMEREDDVPSEFIPSLYFDYLRTGDAGRISRVFYHNQMDILAMAALAGRIHLVYHDPGAARPRKGVEHFALGKLFWDHKDPDKAVSCFEIALSRCDDDLGWEVMKWLSMAFKKTGKGEKALSLWEEMAAFRSRKDPFPFVELAKYYEHRKKDFEQAAAYVDRALEMTAGHPKETELLHQRKRRLEQKRSLSALLTEPV